MHVAVLVVHRPDENAAQLVRDHVPGVDWAAIGGRFTGRLTPRPGATSAKVHGDAMPQWEADFATWHGDNPEGVALTRGTGCPHGSGVDQAALIDLDPDDNAHVLVHGVGVVLADRRWYDVEHFRDMERAQAEVDAMDPPDLTSEEGLRRAVDDASRAGVDFDGWAHQVSELLDTAPEESVVSIVDAHR